MAPPHPVINTDSDLSGLTTLVARRGVGILGLEQDSSANQKREPTLSVFERETDQVGKQDLGAFTSRSPTFDGIQHGHLARSSTFSHDHYILYAFLQEQRHQTRMHAHVLN